MRTTVNIEDDLLAAAKSLARARSQTLGQVISELIRKGLHTSRSTSTRSGFPVFDVPAGAHPITLEDTKQLEDET
jgi:hypothetical protein